MMGLPFLMLFGALAYAWMGRRSTAVVLWGASVTITLMLLRMIAGEPLFLGR